MYIHSVQLWVPFLIFLRGWWSDARLGVADMRDNRTPQCVSDDAMARKGDGRSVNVVERDCIVYSV